MRKYTSIFILLLITTNSYSQTKTIIIPQGVYTGGICGENDVIAEGGNFINYDPCGLWYLKKDASFIFISPTNYGTIQTTGVGKWKWINREPEYSDSIFQLEFTQVPDNILTHAVIDYHGETKYSPDSVYLSGRVVDTKGKPIEGHGLESIPNAVDLTTNKDGYFKAVFPARRNIHALWMQFAAANYYPVVFNFPASNNVHVVNITIPTADSLTCVSIVPNTGMFPIISLSGPRKKGEKLKDLWLVSKDKNYMIDLLNKAKLKQPLLSAHFDALVKLIGQ